MEWVWEGLLGKWFRLSPLAPIHLNTSTRANGRPLVHTSPTARHRTYVTLSLFLRVWSPLVSS